MPLMNKHIPQQERQFSRALKNLRNKKSRRKRRIISPPTIPVSSIVSRSSLCSQSTCDIRASVRQLPTPHGSKIDVCKNIKMLEHSALVLSISDRPHIVSKESNLFDGRRARLAPVLNPVNQREVYLSSTPEGKSEHDLRPVKAHTERN